MGVDAGKGRVTHFGLLWLWEEGKSIFAGQSVEKLHFHINPVTDVVFDSVVVSVFGYADRMRFRSQDAVLWLG